MIAPAELNAFQSEDDKIAYCRAFLQKRGFAVSQPVPKISNEKRDPASVAYIRASTDKQENSGPVQDERIRAAHAQLGASVPPFLQAFEDKAISGTKRLVDRIEGRKLYEFLQGGDHLFITHFDRLGRNVLDSLMNLENFAERGVVLHVLDFFGYQFDIARPEDKVIVTMFCAMAKYYRDQISYRTRLGMKYAKERGGCLAAVPPIGFKKVGYKKESYLVPDYHDQRICQIIWVMVNEEYMTRTHIGRILLERKVRTGHRGVRRSGWSNRRRIKLVCDHRFLPFADCPPDTPTELDDLIVGTRLERALAKYVKAQTKSPDTELTAQADPGTFPPALQASHTTAQRNGYPSDL